MVYRPGAMPGTIVPWGPYTPWVPVPPMQGDGMALATPALTLHPKPNRGRIPQYTGPMYTRAILVLYYTYTCSIPRVPYCGIRTIVLDSANDYQCLRWGTHCYFVAT